MKVLSTGQISPHRTRLSKTRTRSPPSEASGSQTQRCAGWELTYVIKSCWPQHTLLGFAVGPAQLLDINGVDMQVSGVSTTKPMGGGRLYLRSVE